MAWTVSIEDIPAEGLALNKKAVSSDFGLVGPDLVSSISPLDVSLRLEKSGPRVKVKGRFNLRAEFSCSRCLDKFSKEINSSLEAVYEPEEARGGKKEIDLNEEEAECFYYGSDGLIDLGEEVRQNAILAMGVKLLCRENCRGLCRLCGQNLNKGSCSCQTRPLDPRLAKLNEWVIKERKK